jgi:glutamate transport system permease protein
VIAAVIAVAVQRFAANGQLTAEKWKPFTLPYVQKFLWDGLQNTLQITAVSGVLALPLGVVFALLRLSRRPAIRWNATSYIEIAIQVYIVISLISFVINLLVMSMETAPGGSWLR